MTHEWSHKAVGLVVPCLGGDQPTHPSRAHQYLSASQKSASHKNDLAYVGVTCTTGDQFTPIHFPLLNCL